jgi:hypothetical protein
MPAPPTANATIDRHLADLSQPIPGGRRHSTGIAAANFAKLKKLEEEADRLRQQIDDRKKHMRREVREWERDGRLTDRAHLAGDLAAENLKTLDEMGVGEDYVPENGDVEMGMGED